MGRVVGQARGNERRNALSCPAPFVALRWGGAAGRGRPVPTGWHGSCPPLCQRTGENRAPPSPRWSPAARTWTSPLGGTRTATLEYAEEGGAASLVIELLHSGGEARYVESVAVYPENGNEMDLAAPE